jgi:hypothetical protein
MGRLEAAGQVRQPAGQDLPQPRRQLRVALAAKLTEVLMRLEQRLLHHVRSVPLALRIDAGASGFR